MGHRISGAGVKVDPDKILAVQQWPLPTTVRGLRGFLGLTGYYRRFVPNYASLASPLTDLLRKTAFVWTMEATMAFDALKTALTTTPVLQLPRFDQQFELQPDTSATRVGVVLLQGQHPVANFSKSLTP